MPRQLEATPTWLRASVTAARVGADRANRVILGAVIAQEGPFREPDPRGEFDAKALKGIVALMKDKAPAGLKARFGHPSLSSDAAGSAIGRWRNPRLDSVTVDRDGGKVTLQAVRADLHLDASAFETNPNGNLGEYLLTVAESDPGLISSSLVLQVEEEYRLNKDGTAKLDDNGNPLPPLWRPTILHAADITDEGAAVDQLLSPGGADLSDAVVRQASAALDRLFSGQPRAVIEARCSAWLGRYLNARFPVAMSASGVKCFDKDGNEVRLDAGVNLPAGTTLTAVAPAPLVCPYDDLPCQEGCPSAEECEQEYEAGLAKDEPLHAEIEVRVRSALLPEVAEEKVDLHP